ncbi:hypothetical protein B5F54_07800 [Anaeromassilibacillus sp. An250]|nr:hypothetical protein B5F54_07800 [Anaeromassilibacillus sp. An250]
MAVPAVFTGAAVFAYFCGEAAIGPKEFDKKRRCDSLTPPLCCISHKNEWNIALQTALDVL